VSWLQDIPNLYVHFGDFDLAGISIYLTEFYRYLGQRSAFFVPEDVEERLSKGSRKRYYEQFPMYGKMDITDPRLEPLVQLIHRHQKGYDQEGFIDFPS
jgi:glutathione peroxidase-family protein